MVFSAEERTSLWQLQAQESHLWEEMFILAHSVKVQSGTGKGIMESLTYHHPCAVFTLKLFLW